MNHFLQFGTIILFGLGISNVECLAQSEELRTLSKEKIEVRGELPDEITESSGQELLPDNSFVGHNDSGADPVIYWYSEKGEVNDIYWINRSSNVDWEDVAIEADTLYIADTGNNGGWRKTLSVYRTVLDKEDDGKYRFEPAEEIRFKYPDRRFRLPWTSHNYDCEALFVFDGRLWVFSKNHKDKRTNIYSMPKTAGSYTARYEGSFESGGLITGADISGDQLVLLGYNRVEEGFSPFIWYFRKFDPSNLNGKRTSIPYFMQTEAICFGSAGDVFFTNEEEEGGIGRIFRVSIEDLE